jgi:hypothetical protein
MKKSARGELVEPCVLGVSVVNLGGVLTGPRSKVYYHNVKLVVGADIVEIKAGFCWDLTENLLGHFGFFDNFIATFNTAFEPPCFDIERVHRH